MNRRNIIKNLVSAIGLVFTGKLFALPVEIKQGSKIRIRKSADRGKAEHGWLTSKHSFSFAGYRDSRHMGFRNLRVINQDIVKPLQGFPTHGHADMEILSYVIDGQLKHEDSNGNIAYIKPGDIQRMTAGSGTLHSEYNASSIADVHFLQIWLLPSRNDLKPGYDQKFIGDSEKRNKLSMLAGVDDGAIRLNSSAYLYSSLLDAGKKCSVSSKINSNFWIQVISGEVEVLGKKLSEGDGASIEGANMLEVKSVVSSHFIVFDLA